MAGGSSHRRKIELIFRKRTMIRRLETHHYPIKLVPLQLHVSTVDILREISVIEILVEINPVVDLLDRRRGRNPRLVLEPDQMNNLREGIPRSG